jgi:ribosomal protein S18 acetylase RimI-like enzyme
MKHAFLASQFALQTRHYAGAYADSEALIVTWNGEPVGRLHLSHTDTDLRIVDVSLLPDHRGGGLGSALLQAVQAAAGGRTVSLNVDLTNPAQALYRRMGFVEAGTDGLSLRMVWHPA